MENDAFQRFADEWRPRIDEALSRALADLPGCPPPLADAMRYAALAPGKRIRPLLTLLGARLCGGEPADALQAACAVEAVHAFSLVHDDLPGMDDDDLRRGRPTTHKVYGEAEAILAGDALLILAFEILSGLEPAARARACIRVLAEAAGRAGMCGGQSDDMRSGARGEEELAFLHGRKTGMLLAAALETGAIVANGSADDRAMLRRIGMDAGLAYQIVDDLLDATGDAASLGKTPGKDAAQGKVTFLTLLGEEAARERAKVLLDACVARLEPYGEAAEELQALCRSMADRSR